MPIHARGRPTALARSRYRHAIAASASHPQIQRTRPIFRSQVVKNGACQEKLPSEKRKEYRAVMAIETKAASDRIANGRRRAAVRLRSGSGAASRNSGSQMTADSFESK